MDNPTNPIQATFEHGVFRPMTPVELPDGCQVQLSFSVAGEQAPSNVSSTAASIEEQLRQLAQHASADAWKHLPADLSDRIDYHVYGVE